MGERRGTKALELWCRRITDGYPGVNVQNMTTSWRDGLAFCAMIHHFRPDLIDFASLNKDDIYGNNELAFRTAEQHLGIPALLDAEDMASCSVPDRLSILTYLSQFYQVFGVSSPSRLALNRTSESSNERIGPVPESPKPKVSSRLGMRREPCASCGLPVFLAEKLVVSRSVYHRSCFRCARCQHQLTPGNYYETEEGQYCCEACPGDEELDEAEPPIPSYRELTPKSPLPPLPPVSSPPSPPRSEPSKEEVAALLEAPLSDEEKSKRRSLERGLDRLLRNQRSKLDIMTSHLLGDKLEEASDDEKTARNLLAVEEAKPPAPSSSLLLPDEDDDNDDKFDHMIKLISERIDELTTEEQSKSDEPPQELEDEEKVKVKREETEEQDQEEDEPPKVLENENEKVQEEEEASPETTKERHDSRVNTAPNVVQFRRASVDEARTQTRSSSVPTTPPALRRSSSLRSASEHTKDQRTSAEPRRLSLVQHRLRLFESPEQLAAEQNNRRHKQKQLQQQQQQQQDVEDKEYSQSVKPKLNIPASVVPTPKVVADSAAKTKEKAQKESDYPDDLNPFASDEEKIGEQPVQPVTRKKKKKEPSTNPFGSSSDEEEEETTTTPPKPVARTRSRGVAMTTTTTTTSKSTTTTTTTTTQQQQNEAPKKRVLEAPQINLNPFWSDGEEPESGAESEPELRNKSPPVPKPRTLRHSHMEGGLQPKSNLTSSSIHSSNTSIASSCSTITPGGTYRKKKPAPPPPLLNQSLVTPTKSHNNSNSSTSSNPSLSPRLTPRTRKSKPAPPPPLPTAASTPTQKPRANNNNLSDTGYRLGDESSCLKSADNDSGTETTPPQKQQQQQETREKQLWDDEKLSKDEANRNTQSLGCMDGSGYLPYQLDKSVEGKWKRKKGPAPPRPMPLRRKIKVMSMKDVKLELDQIEMQQQGLEKQGVRLEQIIRDKCESGTASEDTSLGLDVEELVLELFALVNEKNELFRRQAELMLLRRQQRLEEEHADIEYQVRCLITQPEATKTDFDKQREETLIQRLVEIVERRNEIVECLEMDRRREIEEDRSIHREMDLYAGKFKIEK